MGNIITSSTTPFSAFAPAKFVIEMMQKDFEFPIKERMAVVADVDMFRIGEDSSIHGQAKSGKYEYGVYFDGEFVCFFSLTDHPQRVRIKILNGLKELVKEEKIFWNKHLYEVKAKEKAKNKRDRIEAVKQVGKQFKTSEEKLAVAAIERHVIKSIN